MIGTVGITRSFVKNSSYEDDFILFELDRKGGILPLGWFLSENAQAKMNEQIKNMSDTNGTSSINQSFKKLLHLLPK